MGYDEVFVPFAVAAITPLGCAWVASRFVPPTNKWVYGGVIIGTAFLSWKYIVPRMLTSMGYPVPFDAESFSANGFNLGTIDDPICEICGSNMDEDGDQPLRRGIMFRCRNRKCPDNEGGGQRQQFYEHGAESFSAEGDSGEVSALKKALKAYKWALEDCLDGRYGTDDAESVMDDLEDSHHIVRFLGAESKFIRPYDRKGKIDFRRDNKGRYRRKLSIPLKKNAEGDSQRYEMQARWARDVVDRAITKGCFSDELVKTLQDEADKLGMSVGSK